jgi:acetoin utilization deacetylase AcuC-like enzyme
VYDPVYLEHDTGPGFPENPSRLVWLKSHLEKVHLWNRLLILTCADAPDPIPWIRTVHSDSYLERLRTAVQRGEHLWNGDPDCPISSRSWRVAECAVAGVLAAVDAVASGRVRNAFAAVRPPGHHAMPDRAKGFCLLNNVAIATRYVQRVHRMERVMIVDWDVHHGDGTQTIFYQDPTVFYFSTHQYPFYPGPSGSEEHTGAGAGRDTNLNVPLPAGSGDRAVLEAFERRLAPAIRRFQPQWLFISAGFDAHHADPLGGLGWSDEVYAQLTFRLRRWLLELGHERIVSVLEGGYSRPGMTTAVAQHLAALMEPIPSSTAPAPRPSPTLGN